MRTNYTKANIEVDIDMKKQYKIYNILCPQEFSDAVCKSYVDSGLNDPSIMRNTAHVDFNDKNFYNVSFVKVNTFTSCSRTSYTGI